jgi:hypothetical protein
MSDSKDDSTTKPGRIVLLKVGGTNYTKWFESLEMTLALKGLSGYIKVGKGGLARKQRPEDSAFNKQEAYNVAVEKTMALIRLSLSDNRATIRGESDPIKALSTIKEYFSQATKYDIGELQTKWVTLVPNGDDFTGYMAEMNRIKSNLASNSIVYNNIQMVAQMMVQLEKYHKGHPYKKAYDAIEYKLGDDPDGVTKSYFSRIIAKATHKRSNEERVNLETEKAFSAQAMRKGWPPPPALKQAVKGGSVTVTPGATITKTKQCVLQVLQERQSSD